MEYELKHYYQVKLTLVLILCGFLKKTPKDDFEREAQRVIRMALTSLKVK